jgi:hypothetical protein
MRGSLKSPWPHLLSATDCDGCGAYRSTGCTGQSGALHVLPTGQDELPGGRQTVKCYVLWRTAASHAVIRAPDVPGLGLVLLAALLAAGRWLLAAGRWLLAAGCWLLAAGCWLLAAGCWLLAAGSACTCACTCGCAFTCPCSCSCTCTCLPTYTCSCTYACTRTCTCDCACA